MNIFKIIAATLLIFFGLIKNAFAYLEPGTISMIINFFIAIIAGIATYISFFWSKFKKLFKKKQDIKSEKNEN